MTRQVNTKMICVCCQAADTLPGSQQRECVYCFFGCLRCFPIFLALVQPSLMQSDFRAGSSVQIECSADCTNSRRARVCDTTGRMRTLQRFHKQSINMHQPEVCCVSLHSLKSLEKIPGDRQLLQQSQTEVQKVLNPSAGPVTVPLYMEEQDEHCQRPTK